jgi:hypothetical protein
VVRYRVKHVPVTLLLTRHNDESRRTAPRPPVLASGRTARRLLAGPADRLQRASDDPGRHGAGERAASRPRSPCEDSATTTRGKLEHVDHAFTCSQFLTDHYHAKVGLESTPLEPPIDWAAVVAPADARAFVTFVNPSRHKGLLLFAKLADAIGSRRPDIPMLVVQSGHSGGSLNAIPGIDFSRYPQIMAAPPVPTPADYFADAAPAGPVRVGRAVRPRGGRGDDQRDTTARERSRDPCRTWSAATSEGGGGRVLPIPGWMTAETTKLPSEREIQPWYDAVCELWDTPALYASMADRARRIAEQRYSEFVSRSTHVEYFTSLKPGGRPIRPRGR